jgi:hypothetical protein
MRTVPRLLVLFGALVMLSGCTQLTIRQYTLQGDISRGYSTRIQIARGIRDAIVNKLGSKGLAAWSEDAKEPPDRKDRDDETKKLFEFASRIEHMRAWDTWSKDLVDDVKRDAGQIKRILAFPAFDQIALTSDAWREINPVEVFGGFGKTEYIVVRDDGGNYELKSGASDPSRVIAAISNITAGAVKTAAAAYGVPVGPAGTGTQTGTSTATSFDPSTSASLEPQTKFNRDLARQLDAAADRLRLRLKAIQDAQLPADAVGELNEAKTRTLKADLREAIEGYRSAVAGLSRGVTPLQGLEARLPGTSSLDKLVSLFGVGSFTDGQVVALYWGYRLNPSDAREARLIKLTLPSLIDFEANRPKAREGLSAAAVNATLDDLNRGDKLTAGVNATRGKQKAVNNAWVAISLHNETVPKLKKVFDTAFANIDAATEDERATRAKNLIAVVPEDFKKLVKSPPDMTTLSEANAPSIQALATKLPAATFNAFNKIFTLIDALGAKPSAQALKDVKAEVKDGLLDPVALPDPLPEFPTDLKPITVSR